MTEQAKPFKRIQNQIGVQAPEVIDRPLPRATEQPEYADQDTLLPPDKQPSVLDSLVAAGWLNWELLIWLALIALAVVTRLWDLAPRAFHHDENNHSWFSYDMYKGINVYRYDPTWHGPVLYYMVTLSYFLLGGATEFSSRFAPAMFGIGLVALCYFLRPLLGRIGAIAFAILVLVSPSILYYSRSLRHDIFATFGMLLFVIGLFRFAQAKAGSRREVRWVGLAGLGFFVLFGSHEMSFLNLGIVLSWLGVVFLFEIIALPAKFGVRRQKLEVRNQKLEGSLQEPLPNRVVVEADDAEMDEPTLAQTEIWPASDEAEAPLELNKEAAFLEQPQAQPAVLEEPIPDPTRSEPSQIAAPTDTLNEAEAPPSVLSPQSSVLNTLFTNFKPVYYGLFGLFAVMVVLGSLHLFVDKTSDGTLQKLFGIDAYFVLIPLYIGLAAAVAYPLARFITYGYSRLSARSSLIARISALVVFVGLALVATLLFLRGASPAGYVTAVNLQFSGNVSPAIDKIVKDGFTSYNEFAYIGLKWPSLLPQLVAIGVAAVLAGALVGWLWERRLLVYTSKGLFSLGISFFFVLFIACLISLRFVLVPDRSNLPKGNLPLIGTLDKWLAYVIGGAVLALVIGVVAGWFVSLAERIDDSELRGSAVLRAVLKFARNPWAVLALLLGFGVLYVLIFSNFFFAPERLADGFYRGLEYWIEQHDKRRLDEPWFYYPLLMLLYETFAVIFTFVAAVYFPVSWWRRSARRGRLIFTVRGVFIGLTFWWSALALVAYSIAGEKVPWLNIQVALPFSLATAAFLNDYLSRLDWKRIFAWKEGLLFALLLGGMLAVLFVMIGQSINFPRQGVYSPNLSRVATSSDVTLAIVEMVLVGLIGLALFGFTLWLWWGYRLSGPTARAVLVLMMGGLVFAYCVKSTIMLNYGHPDTAVEPMIYTQTTPEIPLLVQRLDRLGRDIRDTYKLAPAVPDPKSLPTINPDPANIKSYPIFVSGEAANPLNWYLRQYSNVCWCTVSNDPNNATPIPASDGRGNPFVVILVSVGENTSRLQQQLGDKYVSHQYKVRWNFPEDDSGYGGLGYVPPDDFREERIAKKDIINTRWDLIWRSFTEQPYADRLWRYVMYHELWMPLPSFDLIAYVRKDVEADFATTAAGLPATVPAPTTGAAISTTVDESLPPFDLTTSSTPGNRNGQYRVPRNVAIAPNGDILVLDSLNARVQRFDKDGKFLSKFGSAGAGDGQFSLPLADLGPSGITTDEDGNIYVTDTWGYRIEKFDPTGKLAMKWGVGQDTQGNLDLNRQYPASFYGPRSIAYDKTTGELFITDTGNRRVVVYDKLGQFKRQFGSKGNGPGQFDEPVSLALSPDGKVYVADLRNKRIQLLDKQGAYLGEIAVPTWKEVAPAEPYLAFNAQGDLFATDPSNGAVMRYDPSGKLITTYNQASGLAVQNPIGLTFDADGNLYIADAKRHAIVKTKP